MRTTAIVLLLVALTAGLFSFGFVNDIRWGPAQVVFGVSLLLFALTAITGFTPSVQIRPAKAAPTASRPMRAALFGSGKFALWYVTVGGLGLIWCGIWFWYLRNHPPENDTVWYWCYGGLLSSLGVLIIGLGIGRIVRAAEGTELPPENTNSSQSGENIVPEPASSVHAADRSSQVPKGIPTRST